MKKIIIFLLALFAFYKYIFYIPSFDNVSTPYNEPVSIDVVEYQPKTKAIPTFNNVSTPYKEPVSIDVAEYQPKTKAIPNYQSKKIITYTKNSPETAFNNHFSRVQVEGTGTVLRILRDDTKGSRHQKFILKLASGQTLLVAHNIDLSPRLNGLSEGDIVEFYGQYEWNSKGGVLHWTHHDPRGRHKAGWLKYNGRTYQ